jgi:hypothetical protein
MYCRHASVLVPNIRPGVASTNTASHTTVYLHVTLWNVTVRSHYGVDSGYLSWSITDIGHGPGAIVFCLPLTGDEWSGPTKKPTTITRQNRDPTKPPTPGTLGLNISLGRGYIYWLFSIIYTYNLVYIRKIFGHIDYFPTRATISYNNARAVFIVSTALATTTTAAASSSRSTSN